jgi:hypothetical protein
MTTVPRGLRGAVHNSRCVTPLLRADRPLGRSTSIARRCRTNRAPKQDGHETGKVTQRHRGYSSSGGDAMNGGNLALPQGQK